MKKLALCKLGNKKNNKNIPQRNDSFDVKKNLNKLKAFGDKYSGSPTEDPLNENSSGESIYTSSDNRESFQQTTFQEIKHLNNKLNSDISGLKDQFHSTKEGLTSKITVEIDVLKKNLENKIDKKVDEKIFIWAIGVLIVIAGIIGTFSYYPMGNNIKELQEKNNKINDSLNKTNNRIEKINMILKEKKR